MMIRSLAALAWLGPLVLVAGAAARPAAAQDLRVPPGWTHSRPLVYLRRLPGRRLGEVAKAIRDGHQACRLEGRMIAAECLVAFSIPQGSNDLFQVADQLVPGRQPGEWCFREGSREVVVTVRKGHGIPVARCLRVVPACEQASTTLDMRACACRKLEDADAQMVQVYLQLLEGLGDPAQRRRLVRAQRRWMRFREAMADFEAAFYAGGTVAPQIRSAVMERLTRERSAELGTTLADEVESVR